MVQVLSGLHPPLRPAPSRVISTAQYCFVFRTTVCTSCDTFTLLQTNYGAHPPCPADMLNQSQALIFQ